MLQRALSYPGTSANLLSAHGENELGELLAALSCTEAWLCRLDSKVQLCGNLLSFKLALFKHSLPQTAGLLHD